eukprot:97452-Pyramimonas_sp.AAC.1
MLKQAACTVALLVIDEVLPCLVCIVLGWLVDVCGLYLHGAGKSDVRRLLVCWRVVVRSLSFLSSCISAWGELDLVDDGLPLGGLS